MARKRLTFCLANRSTKIEWQHSDPGGLSIFNDEETTLADFVCLDYKQIGARGLHFSLDILHCPIILKHHSYTYCHSMYCIINNGNVTYSLYGKILIAL